MLPFLMKEVNLHFTNHQIAEKLVTINFQHSKLNLSIDLNDSNPR